MNRTSRSLQVLLNPIGNNSTCHPSRPCNGTEKTFVECKDARPPAVDKGTWPNQV